MYLQPNNVLPLCVHSLKALIKEPFWPSVGGICSPHSSEGKPFLLFCYHKYWYFRPYFHIYVQYILFTYLPNMDRWSCKKWAIKAFLFRFRSIIKIITIGSCFFVVIHFGLTNSVTGDTFRKRDRKRVYRAPFGSYSSPRRQQEFTFYSCIICFCWLYCLMVLYPPSSRFFHFLLRQGTSVSVCKAGAQGYPHRLLSVLTPSPHPLPLSPAKAGRNLLNEIGIVSDIAKPYEIYVKQSPYL